MTAEQIVDAEIVDNLPAVRASQAIVARDEITVDDLVAQADKVKQAMQRAMKPDIHYGRIPGVNKPTLYKPGAETLCVLLRLAPMYESERIWHDDGHLTVVAKVRLQHIPTGYVVAEGEGLCTSRESKYATRKAERVCPACGALAIIKGKKEYGGGWLCFKKKDGCGAKFRDGDPVIEQQHVGTTANPDLPDTFNTVLKMANKRALVAAVLNGTAASDIFTQDVEDLAVADDSPRPRGAGGTAPEDTFGEAWRGSGEGPSGPPATVAPAVDAQVSAEAEASASSPDVARLRELAAKLGATDATDALLAKHAADSEWVAAQIAKAEQALVARRITKGQKQRMHAIKTNHGVPEDEYRRILREVAGVEHSEEVRRDVYEAVCASLEAWEPPPSQFVIPEGARSGASA